MRDKGTLAGCRVVTQRRARYHLLATHWAGIREGAGKVFGLDVAAHVGDGLVLKEAAEGADAEGALAHHELVEVLHGEDRQMVVEGA